MTDLPQAVIDAIDAEDSPWPDRRDWAAAARVDAAGPDARRKILLHGALLAAPHIAAVERERIRLASIDRIAHYVLHDAHGEAIGVTQFVADLLGEPQP